VFDDLDLVSCVGLDPVVGPAGAEGVGQTSGVRRPVHPEVVADCHEGGAVEDLACGDELE
jgi:hypothetical protein